MSHDRVTVNGICFQVKPDVMADGQPYIWFTAFTEDSFARGPLMSCNANSPEGSLHRDVWDAYQAARTTTMSITHGETNAHTRTRVETTVHGAAPLWNSELDAEAVPGHLVVYYLYVQTPDPGGWTHHNWVAQSVSLATAEGENPPAAWYWYAQDGQLRATDNSGQLPTWLAELVDRLRPSGEVSLPRVKGL